MQTGEEVAVQAIDLFQVHNYGSLWRTLDFNNSCVLKLYSLVALVVGKTLTKLNQFKLIHAYRHPFI